MNSSNYLVIMAGGVGTRFWPISRESYPKQFLDILGTGKSLIQQTAERFADICPQENIYVVTSENYYEITKEQLPFLSDQQILLEPDRRNTAPCIAYSCFKIGKMDPDANIIVAPADHIILKEQEFIEKINAALSFSKDRDYLVTLGIKPTRPDTGYGYIQFIEDKSNPIKKVKTFTEKPSIDIAKMFVSSGDYFWNSGIFIWNFRAIEKAMDDYLPEVADAFREAQPSFFTEQESDSLKTAYSRCKVISIDHAIMEKAENVYVVLADVGWSDLGTWKSLYENSEKDELENVVGPKTILYGVENSIIKLSDGKLAVIKDLKNYIVAEHGNVLLICPKDDEQMVKGFVTRAGQFGEEYT